jgi:hypothetical protein
MKTRQTRKQKEGHQRKKRLEKSKERKKPCLYYIVPELQNDPFEKF